MNTYADYNFYINEYKGTALSQESFNSFIVKASKDIERNVNRKLSDDIFEELDEETKNQISYVACELCEYYDSFGGNTSEGKPNSINIDGVSINQSNYSSNSTDTGSKLRKIYDDLPQDWTRYI